MISSIPSSPSSLTPRGVGQAEALRERLAREYFDLCVTSELERAIATADIALDGRQIERVVMADLNDPRAGEFEGCPAAEHRDWLHRHVLAAPNPGGGESQLDALRRYARAFRALATRPEERVLVGAHGMPIAWLRSARRIASAGGTEHPHA